MRSLPSVHDFVTPAVWLVDIHDKKVGPVVPIGIMGDWTNVLNLGEVVPIGTTGDWNNLLIPIP